jgi:hypothetical protein
LSARVCTSAGDDGTNAQSADYDARIAMYAENTNLLEGIVTLIRQ